MKILFKTTMLLLFVSVIHGCSKDDDKGLASLPPATQTGARTFGCLVDGKAFVHNDGPINCFYQLIDGTRHFGIQGKDDDDDIEPFGLNIKSNITLEEGLTYVLSDELARGGGYFSFPQPAGSLAITDDDYSGELTITKLDFTHYIVSGTFWFDVKHPQTGQRVEIREGRFDTHFSQ